MFVKGNNYNKGCIRLRATSIYDTWVLMELNETWFVDSVARVQRLCSSRMAL